MKLRLRSRLLLIGLFISPLIFANTKSKIQRLADAETNWVDNKAKGYCTGIAYIETRFNNASAENIFTHDSTKDRDTGFELERKLRLFLNGDDTIQFNGYSSLEDLYRNSENRRLFEQLATEIQFNYMKNYNDRNDPNAFLDTEALKWPQILEKLDKGQSYQIFFGPCSGKNMHSVTATSYTVNENGVELKVLDSNTKGFAKITIDKNVPYKGTYTIAGKTYDICFVTAYHEPLVQGTLSRTPQYYREPGRDTYVENGNNTDIRNRPPVNGKKHRPGEIRYRKVPQY